MIGDDNRSKRQNLIEESYDSLLQSVNSAEDRLTEQGVDTAHSWMFHVREVLSDLRRVNLVLTGLAEATDGKRAVAVLRNFTDTLLYEMCPHVQQHLHELETMLEAFNPHAESK
jgi:hypothetical protein